MPDIQLSTGRKIPLHLRQAAAQADAHTEKMREIQKGNIDRLASLQVAEPAPAPTVVIQDSQPTILPREPTVPPAPVPAPQLEVQPPTEPVVETPVNYEEEARRYRELYQTREGRAQAEARRANAAEAALASAQEELRKANETRANQDLSRVDDATIAEQFSPDYIKEHGLDYCRQQIIVARRAAADVMRVSVNPKMENLERNVATQGRSTIANRKLTLFSLLDNNEEIKGWRDADRNPLFEEWAASVEPMSRKTYRDLLVSSLSDPDVESAARTCALIYKAYFASLPKTPTPTPAPRGRTLPVGRPPASVDTVTPQPVILTAARMRELKDEYRRAKPERRQAIEKELRDAQVEGRLPQAR